jgi:hypothetical protein
MRKALKVPSLLICGAMLGAPAAFAQGAGAGPYAAGPATPMETRTRTDVATTSAIGMPVVNPPDPQNAGTLAENARTTALATYPWSTADIWFGRR